MDMDTSTEEMGATSSSSSLTRADVQRLVLETFGQKVSAEAIWFYPSAAALADRAAGSRHWSEGETFVFAESAERYAIAVQCAPASCEMYVFTQNGYSDVITAYRLGAEGFADALTCAMDGTPSPLAMPGPGA